MRHVWLVGVLACGPALAQEAAPEAYGDPEAGRAIATAVCSACHVPPAGADDSEHQGRATLPFEEGVPLPFDEIANTPGVTGTALQVWLLSTHPNMPDLILEAQERADLVAYILSLRDREA